MNSEQVSITIISKRIEKINSWDIKLTLDKDMDTFQKGGFHARPFPPSETLVLEYYKIFLNSDLLFKIC